MSYHNVSSTTKDIFYAKAMQEAQEKIFISQGFYRSWKSWKVKEVHLPGLDSHGIGLTTMEAPGK